jgi:2-hydroxy-3-oxopropionate reductase
MRERVGFIGLGVMGRPMARNLLHAGIPLTVHSRSRAPVDELAAEGAATATSPGQVAEGSDIIVTMLPDTPDVEAVLLGTGGVLDGTSDGSLVIDMSTIDPIATRRFARALTGRGTTMLDAPVSGGEVGAKEASLTIMVGGPERAFNKVKPLLDLMGRNVTLVGDNGDGQTTKVANQIIVALTIEAVGEALLFAAKAGADPAKVRKALMGGFASSRILEVHGERMIERRFDPGFRIELHQKDLNLALQGAKALKLGLPNTATCQELFNTCAAHGGAAWDHSAMVRALEIMAKREIGTEGRPAKSG